MSYMTIFFRLLREKPNSSAIAIESMVLFKRNQTAKWLKLKSSDEKKKMFKACIKLGRQQRSLHKQREEEIREYRKGVIKKKEEELIRKREQARKKMESLCCEVSKDGFWVSREEVSSNMKGKCETKKKKMLQTQIRFRQLVLKQPYPDKSIFCFSVAKKKLHSHHIDS